MVDGVPPPLFPGVGSPRQLNVVRESLAERKMAQET